jgi:methionine-rich copper-binding protein CopC
MRLSRWLAAGVVALTLAPAAPAYAHVVYSGSDPAENSTFTEPRNEMWLDFSGVIDPRESQSYLIVTDSCGVEHPGSNYRYVGKRMYANVPLVEPGPFKVDWRVLDPKDGHITHGSFTITLEGSSRCASPTEPSPETSQAPTTSATQTVTPSRPAETPSSNGSGEPSSSPVEPQPDATATSGGSAPVAPNQPSPVSATRPAESSPSGVRAILALLLILGLGYIPFAITRRAPDE